VVEMVANASLRHSGLRLHSLRFRPRAYAWGSAGVRSALLVLCPDGNTGKTEAAEVVPPGRRAADTEPRLAGAAVAVPTAAAEDPERTPLFLEIRAPLPHVAVHVVQSKLVGRIRTNPGRTTQSRPLLSLAEWEVCRRSLPVSTTGRWSVCRSRSDTSILPQKWPHHDRRIPTLPHSASGIDSRVPSLFRSAY
jgi:hypothetical protein